MYWVWNGYGGIIRCGIKKVKVWTTSSDAYESLFLFEGCEMVDKFKICMI